MNRELVGHPELNVARSTFEGFGESGLEVAKITANPGLEAIVLKKGRPSLLIQDDSFEVPESDTWRTRLYPTRPMIEKAIRSVGRVNLKFHPRYPWAGTAWVVDDGVVITNRHVAQLFAERRANGFSFGVSPLGQTIEAYVNFKEEHARSATRTVPIRTIRFIAEDIEGAPDLAILELGRGEGLSPIPLESDFNYEDEQRFIAVIGYPAFDDRNAEDVQHEIFGDIYNVKRLAPGSVMDSDATGFTHDCTTLGGNSGSVLIDVESGNAVGLHYAGEYEIQNYAVKVQPLLDALAGSRVTVTVPKEEPLNFRIEETPPAAFAGRNGYVPGFLGVEIPLPTISSGLVAKVEGSEVGELKYEHFSVVMHPERKMAHFTAVNIDGARGLNIRRGGSETWFFDDRISRDLQIGPDVYKGNRLDRGHLVRRLDPVWGEFEIGKRAERDTFHFTNCFPQHEDLKRKTWLGLEDYVLSHAGENKMLVSVFTGPVFGLDDPVYRSIQLPRQFWKVVAIVKPDGAL
ncbi:MAG: DNA/RNA non-specific endonuclease, partial [Verrucomicrobiales bacterium]